MSLLRATFLFSALLCASYACKSSDKDAPMPTTAADQIEAGKTVFADNCARCHGDSGEGGKKAPPLVGKDALPLDPRPGQKRTAKFHNAMDVAQFVTKNMPPDATDRAEMMTTDYWAVLAFALSANGVKLDKMVGPDNAAAIVLHP